MSNLPIITPKEIVEYFYYHNYNEKVAEIFEINESNIEVKNNKVIKAIAEINFKIKKDFILEISKKDSLEFLINKDEYNASWELNNSFITFCSQKPNFEFIIIKNNQTDYLNFYIDYYISTDFDNPDLNNRSKKFINVQIEKKNQKKKSVKIDLS